MSERKTHWEKVYGSKSPTEVSWYQEQPSLSLRLIRDSGLAHDAAIIDIGGGASTLVDSLCSEGYSNISVLDISPAALEHVKKRLADTACEVTWYSEDVTGFNPSQQFSLWHDRAVLHFLTEKADREKYVDTLKRSLEPGGHLIIMAFAIDGPIKCSGLEIVQYDADKLMAELGQGFELRDSGHETHSTPSGGEQKFAWFHLTRS